MRGLPEGVGLENLPRTRLDKDHDRRRGGDHLRIGCIQVPIEAYVLAMTFCRTCEFLGDLGGNPRPAGAPAGGRSIRTIEMRVERPSDIGRRQPKEETRQHKLLLDVVRQPDGARLWKCCMPREPAVENRHTFTTVHEGVNKEGDQSVSQPRGNYPMGCQMKGNPGENPAPAQRSTHTPGCGVERRTPHRERGNLGDVFFVCLLQLGITVSLAGVPHQNSVR